jgi:circadian clock protein KaiB
VLRLFVTGASSRSQRAIANVRQLCDQYLAGRVNLEIVDVYLHPEATCEHQIIATPTLVKLTPAPVRRVIGDLSDRAKVMASLNLVEVEASREPRS